MLIRDDGASSKLEYNNPKFYINPTQLSRYPWKKKEMLISISLREIAHPAERKETSDRI